MGRSSAWIGARAQRLQEDGWLHVQAGPPARLIRGPTVLMPETWTEPRWVHAHASLAGALARHPNAQEITLLRRRLRHAIAGRVVPGLEALAVELAEDCLRLGRVAEGRQVLHLTIGVLASGAQTAAAFEETFLRIAPLFADLVFVDPTPSALHDWAHALQTLPTSPSAEALRRLGLAYQLARLGQPSAALHELPDPDALSDEVLLSWVWFIRVRALYASGDPSRQAALRSAERWFTMRDHNPALAARFSRLLGDLAYEEGRYLDAAAHHWRAADGETRLPFQLQALLGAANAYLEAGAYGQAREIAQSVLDRSRQDGQQRSAIRAALILRAVDYRRQIARRPDSEFVVAAQDVGLTQLSVQVLLQEAAFAWRFGDESTRALGATFADQALCLLKSGEQPELSLLVCALRFACNPCAYPMSIPEAIAAAEALSSCSRPTLLLQALGLLCKTTGDRSVRAKILSLLQVHPVDNLDPILEVLAIREVI